MPTVMELREIGQNALACKVSRTCGGFRGWAEKLGLTSKSSETLRGQRWEEYVQQLLERLGYRVERQTTRAPFDLLVGGKVRVNVKSATWHAYGACKGYFFGVGRTWERCDVFALVKVNGSEEPELLWVPSGEAQQQTITLTTKHRFNRYTSMAPLRAKEKRRGRA